MFQSSLLNYPLPNKLENFNLSKQKSFMSQSIKKPKPTLESLLKQSQVITGKDLIKQKEDRDKELALFKEAIEFEARQRKAKKA